MGVSHLLSMALALAPIVSSVVNATPAAPIQPIKVSLDLTKLDLFKNKLDLDAVDFTKLDVSKTTFLHGKYSINSGILGLKKSLVVPLPPKDTETTKDAIAGALPILLKQYGVKADKIAALTKEGIPLLTEAVDTIFAEGEVDAAATLARRGLFGKIGEFFEDVADAVVGGVESLFDRVVDTFKDAGCGIFATSTLPAFHVAAGLFEVLNTAEYKYTAHQNYFISALHGSIYKDGLEVIYKAKQPPEFKSAYGTAFGRKIYLKHAAASTCPAAGFQNQIRLILHETTHTAQYKSFDYNYSAFGVKYLYEFCRAGMSYSKNSMEKSARDKADDLDKTLLSTYGFRFFQYWDAKSLQSSLGYPKVKTYSTISNNPTITELAFEKGVLQQKADNRPCFRTFTNKELELRTAASCKIQPPCKDNRRRSPSRPPGSILPLSCTPEGRAKANKACNEKKKVWDEKNKKTWGCGVALRTCG